MFCCSLDISVSYAHTRSRTRRMRRAKASVSIASVSRPAADVGEKPTTPSRYPPAWLLSYIKHHTRAIQKGYVKAHNKVTVKGLRTVHSFMNSKVVGPCLTVIGPAPGRPRLWLGMAAGLRAKSRSDAPVESPRTRAPAGAGEFTRSFLAPAARLIRKLAHDAPPFGAFHKAKRCRQVYVSSAAFRICVARRTLAHDRQLGGYLAR